MKVLSATLLLACLFGVAVADTCGGNALLTTDMIARFGGQSNVLNESRILNASVGICQFMVNQSVCISDAGFKYFKDYLQQYRQNFTSNSQRRDQARYSGVGAQLNSQNQSDPRTQSVIQVGNLFNQTVINFTEAGASSPYNFSAFLERVSRGGWNRYIAPTQGQQDKQNNLIMQNNTQHGNPQMMGVNNTKVDGSNSNQNQQQVAQQSQPQQQESGAGSQQQQQQQQNGGSGNQQQQQQQQQNGGSGTQQQQQPSGTHRLRNLEQNGNGNGNGNGNNNNQGPPSSNSGWMSLQQNLGQAKAKCGVAVMKQYYYATCLSALVSSATNGTVSGSTSDPTVTISSDACSGYKSKCYDYFTYASQAENVLANVQNANSLFAMEIYAIVSNSSMSADEKNAQLNTLASQVKSVLVSASVNATTAPWAPISCNNSNQNSADCNYICTNVISATGFDEDNFNLISSTTDGNVASSSSRRSLASSGSVILSSSSSGINPDSAISDSNSAVVVSAQSTIDSSGNSRALLASLAAFIACVAIAF